MKRNSKRSQAGVNAQLPSPQRGVAAATDELPSNDALSRQWLKNRLRAKYPIPPKRASELFGRIIRLGRTRLNTAEAGELMAGILRDTDYLAVACTHTEFAEEVLGWPPDKSEQWFTSFGKGRWAEVENVVIQSCREALHTPEADNKPAADEARDLNEEEADGTRDHSCTTDECDSPRTDSDLAEIDDAPKHHTETNGAPISAPAPNATAEAGRTVEGIPLTKPSADQPAALEIVHPGGAKKAVAKLKTTSGAANQNEEKLSAEERTLLEQCRDVISRGQDTFVEVGNAIATIIERKLHRETHKKFADYAEEVLGMSARRAYQLKDASVVIDHLKKVNNCSHENDRDIEIPMPTNESQIRLLKNYAPDLQYEIWRDTVAASKQKLVTAKMLAEIIRARDDAQRPKSMDEQEGTEFTDPDYKGDTAKIMAMLHASQNWPTAKRQTLYATIKEWLVRAQ
jgi:hypothetical protein